MTTAPGLLIAAPRSGSGKTTLTLGLMRALSRAGLRVAPAKCGPDYIDPAFHAAAAGRPGVNLDGWTMRPALLDDLASRLSDEADIVLCEGAMGLFDGVAHPGATDDGASAGIAARTGWPVLLVLDVSGQGQSAGAVAKGFSTFRPDVTVAGVVLNRVGSERHRALAARGIEAAGLPVVGALPRRADLTLPERHLGLVQAEEIAGLDARLDALADFVAAHVDLAAVRALARSAGSERFPPHPIRHPPDDTFPDCAGKAEVGANPCLPHEAGEGAAGTAADGVRKAGPSVRRKGDTGHAMPLPGTACPSGLLGLAPPGQRIALARDAAFSFVYPHLLDGWRRAGAEILPFSPLADEVPDASADIVWLPGGYPELHAGRLAANARFLDGLRRFARTRPVHGECGGYMVLGEGLVDAGGARHAMAGLLDLETSFSVRRMTLGYRHVRLLADGPLGRAGQALRGHEFHYATILRAGGEPAFSGEDATGADLGPLGGRRGSVSGSFFHLVDAA